MPRIISPAGYRQLLRLTRSEGPASAFGHTCTSAAVPRELQAAARTFCAAAAATDGESDGSGMAAAAVAAGGGSSGPGGGIDWPAHTLPSIPFPTQPATINTLPSFYETYTRVQPVEAEYLRVVTSSTPGTAAATGTHAGLEVLVGLSLVVGAGGGCNVYE